MELILSLDNGLISKDKFAYRSILANENLILNKYASAHPGIHNDGGGDHHH